MSEAEQPLPGEIRGVLIELHGEQLLLPNAAVAEVIDYCEPEAQAGAPDWLLGTTDWRQRSLAVLRLERLLGQTDLPPSQRRRIVVCHTLGEGARRPFVGIVATSIPRLVRVREDAMQGQPSREQDTAVVHARLSIDGQDALIPDLGELERQVSALA
jgi:chemosensory pili system protein ChpC